MRIFFTYLAAMIPLGILDVFWLKFVGKDFYADHLGFILSKEVNYAPIGFFYPIYALAITFLVVLPALEAQSLVSAFWRGALLGLAAYSAYDLTNHATIANWPLIVTIVDIAWGVAATALSAGAAYFLINYFKI